MHHPQITANSAKRKVSVYLYEDLPIGAGPK